MNTAPPSSFPRKRESSVVAVLAMLAICNTLHAQDFSALDPAAGQALFERNWVPAPASTAASDGLGPYYNARSCAACHPAGGAGALDVDAMNLLTKLPAYGAMLQLRAMPGMKPEARAQMAYVPGKDELLDDGTRVQLQAGSLTLDALQFAHPAASALAADVSVRRAPALHGLAALDQVALAELQARADPDDRDGDGISGRIADGNGRFGWSAVAPSLRAQVARALSLDLGLGSPELPASAGDCTPAQTECLQAARAQTGDEFEAPALVLDLLLAYLAALPLPTSPALEGEGFALFTASGCAACHQPQLGAAERQLHPFTDLLLHDLGPGLASAGSAEWRTAPLWGLGGNPRFLHDGRARSVEEAVLWHGGEAANSAAAYRALNAGQRGVLQAWLLGL